MIARNKQRLIVVLAVVCLSALLALAAGCAPRPTGNASMDPEQVNRAYMSQVNQAMGDLEESLSAFADAVAGNDLAGMRSHASSAGKIIDKIAALEAPEDLADVQAGYVEGTNQLRKALQDYVTLYTDVESATEDSPFDWSTYDKRLADIQKEYDAGIEALKAADAAATAAGSEG